MNTKILLTILVVSLLAACNKDTYNTRPQLTYKKVNSTTLSRNQSVVFTIEVTDAEGDIQDSIFIQKIVKGCIASNFIDKQKMPQFTPTKNLKADIEVTYDYNKVPPLCFPKNDTATFKFWIKDKAKNTSDTVTSGPIIILQ